MAYKPTKFDDSVNAPSDHPLKEFASLLFYLSLIIAVFYIIIGFTIDLTVSHITPEQERKLLGLSGNKPNIIKKLSDPRTEKLQALLDSIPKESLPKGYGFSIHIMNEKEPNAFAVLGGKIFITTGLLDEIKTENGLVFIIGHELGHFANRDHLRSLGRGLVIAFTTMLLFGDESSITGFVSGLTFGIESQYSKTQEQMADYWGIKILEAKYGHVGGANEFFELNHKRTKSK